MELFRGLTLGLGRWPCDENPRKIIAGRRRITGSSMSFELVDDRKRNYRTADSQEEEGLNYSTKHLKAIRIIANFDPAVSTIQMDYLQGKPSNRQDMRECREHEVLAGTF